MKIINKLLKPIYNLLYRIRPPEMVKFWLHKDKALARVVHDKDGALKMDIEGEKYLFPGFPRGHVLEGPLKKLKHKAKNVIFNQVFEEMQKHTADMIPPEKMVVPVREIWRVLEELENAEVVEDMKLRIRLIKKVVCFFLQEDDAYRFRAQWAYERLNHRKMKLSKADKYYMRAKYFKVDHDKFDY